MLPCSQGVQGVQVHPQGDEKNFMGIFVEWGKNGSEFGEVHPGRWDNKVVGGSVWRIWRVREGDD